jgi:hypothetical protein
MALRRLTGAQSNIPYQARSTGGIFGTPVQPNGPTQGSSNQRVLSPGLQAMFEIEDAPPGYTIDDIIRDVVEAGGTIEDAKSVVAKVMPEEGSDYTEQDWQNSWAKNYNDRMYDGGDAPAIDGTSSGDPRVGEAMYAGTGPSGDYSYADSGSGMSSGSVSGDSSGFGSPDYFRQQAEAGNDITPSLPFDSPQVMRQAENLSPVDIPGSAKTTSAKVDTSNMASIEAYVRQAAEARGIDPDIAAKVAKSEGLNSTAAKSNNYQATYVKNGYREPSYGPFQLLVGGPGTGFPKGMGNDFVAKTGLDPADPSTIPQQIDFALDGAARNGWGAWYGAAKVGVGKRDGLSNATPIGVQADASLTQGQPQAQTTTPSARPGLFDAPQVDYSNLPQSVQEANQQIDDARTRMRDYDPRGDQVVATPGINGPQYHEDGVNGTTQKTTPQSYEQTLDQNLMLPGDLQPHQMPGTFYDPSMYNVAPIQPVATESFTLPTEDDANVNYEMVDGARTDPMTSNQAQEMRPHAGSVLGPVNRVEPSTNNFPEGFFGGREPMEIMPSRQGAVDKIRDAHQGGTGYTSEPMYDRQALESAVRGEVDPRTNFSSVATPGENEARTWDAPTYSNSNSVGPGASYSYGSTPRYEDYTYTKMVPQTVQPKQGTYSYDDSDWGLDKETLKELDMDWTLDGIKPLEPVTKMVEKEVTERRRVDDPKPKGPRYSSKVMDIIRRGQAMPLANSQARKPFDMDMRKVGDAVKSGAGMGLLAGNPIAGAVMGGLFNAAKQAGPQLGGLLGGSYQGMHTGGDVPALSRGVQLGGAYDVYADRSGRNTWAVSNGDSVVSRDGSTGWTSVTSNVNGKGPVTTIQNDSNLATNRDPSTMTPIWGGKGDGIFGNGDTEGEQNKIVCTAMNQSYGFGGFRNAIWLKYAKDNLTPYHQTGYHALFLPLVNLGYKKNNKFVRSILEHIARHRSVDLRAEMKGSKRDTLGRIYRAILEPTCYLVGRMIGDKK